MQSKLNSLFRAFALLGSFSFGAAALITVTDVILRKFSSGILGVVDYVQLFVISGAFLAMPYAFAENAHVKVDLFTEMLPATLRIALQAAAYILTLGFVVLLFWESKNGFLRVVENEDISMNIALPMWWYWGPFVLGLGLSGPAICLALFGSIKASEGRADDI